MLDDASPRARVLLVTDSHPMVTSIGEFLEDTGYQLAAKRGGSRRLVRELLADIRGGGYHVIIVDLVSLIYASTDLVNSIRKADDEADIVLITGPGSGSFAMEYVREGVNDFVTRPVGREQLLLVLDRVVERRQSRHETKGRWGHRPLIDGLTGLYNRSYFRERIAQEVAASRRKKMSFSVLLMEIGDPETINCTAGRHAPDDVVKDVSAGIREVCRVSDTIARCDGDEFGIILHDAPSDCLAGIADRILSSLKSGHLGRGGPPVCAAIGISSFPGNADDGAGLLRKADLALAHSRSRGWNTYTLYGGECNGTAGAPR